MIVIRRAVLLALTMTLLLLCGCGGAGGEERKAFDLWRQGYAAGQTHGIEAVVTASDDARAVEYTLRYSLSGDGETVEVLAPGSLAKIKAAVRDDGARLEYDGVALDTGTALAGRLSPLLSLPTLSRLLQSGHVSSVWTEKRDGESYRVTELENGAGTTARLWQRGDGTPVWAELRGGERAALKINLTKFS